MSVINLSAERDKRQGPDPEFQMKDDFGRPMYSFLLDYEFEGGSWSLQLWAYSDGDAQARVAAMRKSLSYAGQVYASIAP